MKNKKVPVLSSTLESYLEEIAVLQEQYGAVRVTDLAERMGCSMPTVTSAMRRMAALGLVRYERYRPATLTQKGFQTIDTLTKRHRILADFLESILDFSPEEADKEACLLEHKINPHVLTRLGKYLVFLRSGQDGRQTMQSLQKDFRQFLAGAAGSQ